MDSDLCYLPATEALEAFRSKRLSPVDLLRALIARAEETEPHLNAFTDRYFDEALEGAREAEHRYAGGASAPGALEGIPVAVKDEPEIEGKRTTQGSLLLEHHISDQDAYIVERLRSAGAIFHARTATPEFCLLFQTHSRLHGVTRNPWNLEITPGGSSGGSAASLAAGSATLATGSDIGGSIRQPASMCGLVGYKPPYGRNPENLPFSLDIFNHQGPIARTVADCALMQNVMSGPHPRDIATVRPKINIPIPIETDLRGRRIAWSIDLGYLDVDPEIADNTRAILDLLRDLGAVVEEVNPGWTARVDRAALDYYDFMVGGQIDRFAGQRLDLLTDYARDSVERSRRIHPSRLLKALELCGEMYETFGPMMENYEVFICPTATTTRVPAGFNYLHDGIRINGREIEPEMGIAMTHQFNMLSRCPVLAVPSGMAANGIPTGIQIVGKTYDDLAVFRTGAALEKDHPWFAGRSTRPACGGRKA
ncbi:MAG: amidase [Acidobacteriota bacterium]